eukprot:369116-Prymnesium_polylepis.3
MVRTLCPIEVRPCGSHVRERFAQHVHTAPVEPIEAKFEIIKAERHVERNEEIVSLCRVRSAMGRGEQPAMHLNVKRVEIAVVPPTGVRVPKVGGEPRRELGRHAVHVNPRPAARIASLAGGGLRGYRSRRSELGACSHTTDAHTNHGVWPTKSPKHVLHH